MRRPIRRAPEAPSRVNTSRTRIRDVGRNIADSAAVDTVADVRNAAAVVTAVAVTRVVRPTIRTPT